MSGTVDRDRSFAYFVYPFLFDLAATSVAEDGDAFHALSARIAASEVDGKKLWTDWPVPVNDLLPHVAQFLNPANPRPTGRFWQLHNDLKQKHFTGNLSSKIEWTLYRNKADPGIPFVLAPWLQEEGVKPGLRGDFVIQLALFRHGIGFVTVSAQPTVDDLGEWLTFLHHFRFMGHRSGVGVQAEREKVLDPGSKQKARVAHHPVNLLESPGNDRFVFVDVISTVLKASGFDKPEEVFTPGHTLPYAGIFVRGVNDNHKPLAIHRLRNFFTTTEGSNPSTEDLRPDHPAHLLYAHDQWFLQTLNGGSFLAFEQDDTALDSFQKTDLPSHLQKVYFLANLLTLYQRFTLARLSDRVATHAIEDEDGKVWETVHKDLLDFTARGYFTQAMQSDHHHRYYRKWQEVYQTPQLYTEVRDEIRDCYERALLELSQQDDAREKREEEREKRIEKLLTILGAVFIVPSLILSFLGVNLRGITSGDEGLAWYSVALLVVASMGAGGLLLWLVTLWLGRNDGKGAAKERLTGDP